QARDLAAHRRLAQHVACQAETAVVPVRPAAHRAAVAQTDRARIPRQRLQLELRRPLLLVRRTRIRDDPLQLRTLRGVALYRLQTLGVAHQHRFLRHDKSSYDRSGKLNAASSARPASSFSAVVVIAISMPLRASIWS